MFSQNIGVIHILCHALRGEGGCLEDITEYHENSDKNAIWWWGILKFVKLARHMS